MTIEASTAAAARKYTQVVQIDGQPVVPTQPKEPDGTPGIGRLTVTRSFDDRVPRAEIVVNRIPLRYSHGKTVSVDMGYDGFTERRFTGFVESPARGFNEGTITCVGQLWKAFQGVDVPEFDATGFTIKTAIENRLDLAGITDYEVHPSLDYVLGSVVPAILQAGPLADHIDQLMDIRDSEIYQLSTGQILVRPIDFQPAPTAAGIAYDSENQAEARVIDGTDREDWNYFKDKVAADFASVPDGDPTDPATKYTPIHHEAEILGSPIAALFPLGTGAHRTAILSQPLIDTEDESLAYVSRKLTRFARVPRYLSLDLAGDPTLELGQTRAFNLPKLDVSGRWFVYGLVDSDDNAPSSEGGDVPGYHSQVTLRGGDLAGGSVGIYPIAAFTASVTLQMLGDDLYAIVFLDGSPSDAPDGTITAWDWTGDVTGSGEFLTKAVLASSFDSLSITLTVTADNTLTDARTQDVPVDASGIGVRQPAIFAASGTKTMGDPDGGKTWYDAAAAAAGATAVDAGPEQGMAVFGFGDGSLQYTTDYNQTRLNVLAASPANAGITDVWSDKNVVGRWWATTDTGRLLRATTNGGAWSVYKDFGGTYPLHRIATPTPGGVWVFGGRGDVPSSLIQYDATVSGLWQSIGIGGELNLAGASSSLTIKAAYSRAANELGILFAGALSPTGNNFFWTPTVFDGGAGWKEATGLDAALSDGRVAMPDLGANTAYLMYGNRDVWYVDTSSGVPVCTKGADFLPAGFTPNHGLWEGEFLGGLGGVHLIAAEDATGTGEIFKSIDGMQTCRDFRPIAGIASTNWPAGAKCKQVAIGIGQSRVSEIGLVAMGKDASPREVSILRVGAEAWTAPVGLAGITNNDPIMLPLTADVWFVVNWGSGVANNATGQGSYTKDAGVTWQPTVLPAGANFHYAAIDSGGRIWATDYRSASDVRIYYSDDNGDSWTLASTVSAGGSLGRPWFIATHPSDQNVIHVFIHAANRYGIGNAQDLIWVSTNRGTSWVDRGNKTPAAGNDSDLVRSAIILPSGRGLWIGSRGSGTPYNRSVIYSDDNWQTNTIAYNELETVTGKIYRGFFSDISGTTLAFVKTLGTGTPGVHEIWISTDAGTSWAKLTLAQEYDGFTNPDVNNLAGVAFSHNAIIIDGDSGADTLEDVVMLTPVSVDGEWFDLTFDYPHATRGGHGIGVIPS